MRICIHTQYYLPEIGAPQARLSELAKFLNENNFEVTVLTSMPNYPTGKIFDGYANFFKSEKIDGINVIRSFIYPSKSTKIIPRLLSYFSFVLSSLFIGVFKISKQDIIITESPPLFLGFSGFLLSKFKGARWVFNVSDLWPESAVQLGIIKNGLSLKLSKILEEFFYKKSWLITGQSKEIVKNIRHRFPNLNTYRYSNAVDTDKYNPKNNSNFFNQFETTKKVKIVYAGLHGIAQGLDQIIDSLTFFQTPHFRNFHIYFIGDGPDKDLLIKKSGKISNCPVTFIPPQKKNIMPEIWSSSDIALIPLKKYITGAVPSKLYEAMSSGLPIILISSGEPREIVTSANCGLIVDPGDIKSIRDAIIKLTTDKVLRTKMGNNGRKFVKKNFRRSVINKEFLEYIKNNDN